MDKKYFYNDKPPVFFSLLLILQISVISMFSFVFLLVVFREGKINLTVTALHLQWLLVAYFFSIFIQCFRFHKVGSGLIIPSVSAAVYVGPAIFALQQGGEALLVGMMLFVGFCEFACSFFLRYIRILLSKEISGLAIFVVGLQLAVLGFKYAFVDFPYSSSVVLSVVVLGVIFIFGIWGHPIVKNMGIFIGGTVGFLCLLFFPDYFHRKEALFQSSQLAWVDFPSIEILNFHFEFDFSLIPVFLFAMLAAIVRTIGLALIVKQYEDQKWKKPDFQLLKRSIRADGLSCIFSSFFCGIGLNSGPVTTTLAVNARCTSRRVVIGLCFVYLALSFSPKLAEYLAALPSQLIGIFLIYYSVLMFMTGLKVMDVNKFTTREMFSVGLSMAFAVSLVVFPKTYQLLPRIYYEIISNPLSSSLLLAVILSLLFQIKRKETQRFKLKNTGNEKEKISSNLNKFGESWKVPKEYMYFATQLIKEVTSQIHKKDLAQSSVEVECSYDKFNLSLSIRYRGELLQIANIQKDKIMSLIEDEAVSYGLIHFFKGIYPDKIHYSSENENCQINLTCFLY